MWDEAQTAVELECEPGIMDTEIEQADVFSAGREELQTTGDTEANRHDSS